MEQRGTLKSWNDAKGFGFIQPEGAGEQLFVHISAMRGDSRPQVGDAVLYVPGTDAQGRPRAQHMRHAGLALDRPAIRRKPAAKGREGQSRQQPRNGNSTTGGRRARAAHAGSALRVRNLPLKLLILAVLCVLPAVGSLSVLAEGMVWVALAYPLLSLFSFCQYWLDKQSAQKGRWRTPENSLHIAELAGGWPGALVAQQVFRHKTRKASFQLVFWGIVSLHQLFWCDYLLLNGRYLGHLLPI